MPRSGLPSSALSPEDLREAALAYLGRRPATAAMLSRVLERRIATWARRLTATGGDPTDTAERLRTQVPAIVARLVEVGLVNDASFAASRVQRLERSGRSARAIAAHLAQKGVREAITREALIREPDAELVAALVLTKKRRIGPFTREPSDSSGIPQKALAILARAGFSQAIAMRALRMDRDEAEERLGARRAL